MSVISKIHDMEPQKVFDLVRAHGMRGTCKILKVGTHALARFLKLHHYDDSPQWTKKHVLQHYINNGFSAQEMAAEFGCNIDTVYTWLGKFDMVVRNKPWTAQEEKYLQFMAFQEPWPVVAEKLGRTIASVQVRAKRLGLKSRAMVGYTIEHIASDVHMDPTQIRLWHQQLGLKLSTVKTTKLITVNPVDFYEWLQAGNIFRIEDISKCAHWLKELHASAMQEYITTKEIYSYTTKVMDYAARQEWPGRVVPQPLVYIQRNGIGMVYKRAEVYEWLKHYRYTLPRRITNTMPNYLWWRDFANEWDYKYIYRSDVMAIMNEYRNKIGFLRADYGFPKSTDSMHGYFVRAELISWCRTTGMYSNLLQELLKTI